VDSLPAASFEKRILTELHRCILSTRVEREISRVVVTGEGSWIRGLPETLTAELELPVERIDLADIVASDLDTSAMESLSTGGGVALGLALKQLGVDPVGVNFRQESFRYQKAFEQVKIVLSCCVSLVAILFLIILAFLLERKREAALPWNLVVSRSRSLYEQAMPEEAVAGNDFEVINRMLARVGRSNREYRKRFGGSSGGEFPPLRSALDIWKDVFRGIQMARVGGLILDSMLVTQTGIRMTGSVADSDSLYTLKDGIQKASDLFVEVNPGTFKTEKDGRFSFPSFTIKLPEE
jgi:hypothetical protein